MDQFDSSGGPSHKAPLQTTQKRWLASGHVLKAAEHLHAFIDSNFEDGCNVIPRELCFGLCVPNPFFIACVIGSMIGLNFSYVIMIAATIVYEVFDRKFELDTLGPDQAIYGYQYSQATYVNTKQHHQWNAEALKSISNNMKEQHTEMKRQLQVRHKDISNHLGEDIADAQNALGIAIVDAQNELGQQIVDTENILGRSIVDGRNANGQAVTDAQNYITLQHNKLSQWLHETLCIMYEKNGGNCDSFVGPLEKEQSFIPTVFHWPAGQPTTIERLEQIQQAVFNDVSDDKNDGHINKSTWPGGFLKASVEDQDLGAFINVMESKLEADSAGMHAKMDAQSKEVEEVKDNMDEVKAMVLNLLELNKNLMDRIVKE